MTPDEIQAVVEAAIANSAGMSYAQIALLTIIVAIASFFGAYLQEKAKSTATKQDIGNITHKIEEVKKDLEQRDRILTKKYELKYQACLEMLGILDAHLSHIMSTDNEGESINTDKQYATVEEARSCHNRLLLTIDNPEIVKLYLKMTVGGSDNPMVDLDQIRHLLRDELGFGGDIYLDGENTWLAVVNFKE